MLTLIFALIAAMTASFFTFNAGEGGHWGYALLASLGALLVVLIPVNLVIRKKLMAICSGFQNELMAARDTIQRKAMALQNKGAATPKLQEQLEAEMTAAVRRALPLLDAAKPMYIWSVMVKKQIDTMRGQMLFQIRDYNAARPFLEKALAFDPMIICMQMVLAWKKGDEKMDKTLEGLYRLGIARFKYDKALLIYALYSWILVEKQNMSRALEVLADGKDKTSNEIIEQNWKAIANNQPKRFSNAGLGDQWYALGLEMPPIIRQRMAAGQRWRG